MGARRRRGLADLIGEVGAEPRRNEEDGPRREAAAGAPEQESGGGPRGGGEAVAQPVPARRTERERPDPTPRPVPKYLRLERKEARLRGDQVDGLSSLARRVNRSKAVQGGERITENTLIRVAVDWLLSQEAYVWGSTEEEIRRGLGVTARPLDMG